MSTILLIAGAGCFLIFAYYLSKNVLAGWYCFLAASALGVTFNSGRGSFGAVNLDVGDIATIGLLFAGLIRSVTNIRKTGRVQPLILAFLGVFSLSLIRGFVTFGFFPVSNEARGFAALLSALFYFTTVPKDDELIEKIVRAYILYGVVLTGVALLHYAGLNVGASSEWAENADKNRALPSDAAAAITLAFFLNLAWVSHRPSRPWMKWSLVLLAGIAIALQHRSIWNMLLAGAVSLFLVDIKMMKRLAPVVVISALLIPLLLVGVYGSGDRAQDELEDSANNTGTLEWRLNAWLQLAFAEDQKPFEILFGQPMATPIIQFQQGSYEVAPPHSEYVFLYLRFGIVGVILVLAILLQPLGKLYVLSRTRKLSLFPSASGWFLIHLGVLIYGITYNFESTGMMLVGVANALLLQLEAPEEDAPALLTAGSSGVPSFPALLAPSNTGATHEL